MSTTAERSGEITEHESQQVERANASGRTPVVFIHGLWLLPTSWDRWKTVFEQAGYAPIAPGAGHDPDTVAEANTPPGGPDAPDPAAGANAPPEVFANKKVGMVADHFAEVIGKLKKKPAVIGH